MNNIDQEFFNFIKKVEKLTKEEIFLNIKNKYLMLSDDLKNSIEKFLNEFMYWGKLDYKNDIFEEIDEKATSIKEHLKDYVWLYQKLEDYTSKKLLLGILNNWYKYDFITIKSCLNNPYFHYFDLDIISHCNNEVLVDLGSYVGDTIKDYINTYGDSSYNKIYCYEITKDTFAILKNNLYNYKNIIYRNVAVTNKVNETMYINTNENSSSANKIDIKGKLPINTTSLDEDIKEKISIIKMDIEGSEQDAIKGSINHIKNDNPKMLISVYHNNEDLWKIPRMIDSINNNYKYYLRCYGNNIFPTEIVLIAVPKKDLA